MNWIKQDNKFVIPNNNINYELFKESLNTFDTPDDSFIYIPTHNIHDIYEWYRLFNDSYAYTNNFDEYGFAIHGWFSKNRGQSIQGWYPNLYEVKVATSDSKEYYIDALNDYYRRSVDFIDNFTMVENLYIDGIKLLPNDIVLIKDQHFEEIFLFDTNQSLTNKNSYYCKILPHETVYFDMGNNIILKDINGNYHEDKIINISYTNVLGDDYIILKTENIIENVDKLADLDNGLWIYNTKDGQNGIYYYDKDFNLKPIIHMYDRNQTYNQIIYSYLGDTNQNKEFYLRRNENITSTNYTTFPFIGQGEPLYYSEGSAYLIKCRFHYDLSIKDNAITFDPNCCLCNLQIGDPHVNHPTTSPPYDINSTAFRLLFLDNSAAEKIFSSYDLGVGEYKLDNLIDINDPLHDISFHINSEILDDLYYNTIPGSPITITNNFIYKQLNTGESYEILFDDFTVNDLKITQNYTTVSTTSNGVTTSNDFNDSTTLYLKYNNTDIFPTTNVFNIGDYLLLEIIDNDLNETILNHKFIVTNSTMTNADIEVEIFQPFTKELIDELTLKQTGNVYADQRQNISFKISSINTFGLLNTATTVENRQNLLDTINKSVVGQIYELRIFEDLSNNFYLIFDKIKQNLKTKYFDLKCDIKFDSTSYVIDSAILADYRQYFYGYNIEDYLKNYLGLQSLTGANNLELSYLQDETFIYKNDILLDDRFDVTGSNKNPATTTGNIITYGRFYKQIVLDKIDKHTLIKIEYDSYPDQEDVFIYDLTWDEELNYGKIILSKEIQVPVTVGENMKFVPYKDVIEISTKLKTIFDKNLNNDYSNNHNVNIDFPDYRIQTMSYAHAFMNYANGKDGIKDEILNNITAIFYNSYNELQTSFLKRDRYFNFEDDKIISVVTASIVNINLSSVSSIDGISLSGGDLVIIKEQLDQAENGIYVYDSGSLTRYSTFRKNIYWNVTGGSNINKTFVTYFVEPFIIDSSVVSFVEKSFKTKKDPRLTLLPVELYKLCVDNDTQPPIKINSKYDIVENVENLINISPGINATQQIRFIDGLTEDKILNDIDGQGKFKWILDENVITNNAIVGCTQTSGPGTGDLIWYTGTWLTGIWCYGIWIQGTWIEGTWLDGIRKANGIIDNYNNVSILSTTNNTLSVWKNGTWYKGTNEAGIFENVKWLDGTFNNGLIIDGTWDNGTFNNGKIEHIVWETGTFNGGYFLTGLWKDGIFDQPIGNIEAHFGFGASDTGFFKDRCIWRTGEFNGGYFHSGVNSTDHRLSIWYSGVFDGGTFVGGSFIFGSFLTGVWKDGVWFGGYQINSLINTTGSNVELEIDPEQYDEILGLAGVSPISGYIPNDKHNVNKYNNKFILYGVPTNSSTEADAAFINIFYLTNVNTDYTAKNYVPNTATDTSLELDITTNISNTSPFVQPDLNTNTLNGNPMLLSKFNGTFESGTWLQGYFGVGIFESGIWVNGFFNNGNFGLEKY